MKRLFLFLLFILFLFNVSALEFSPSSLDFVMNKDQQLCKTIFFNIDGQEASIQDYWADSSSEDWTISKFKTTASELSLQIFYPTKVSLAQSQVQVCIKGTKSSKNKGALIFKQEKEGNSLVQFVVWLNVSVQGIENPQKDENKSKNKRSPDEEDSSPSPSSSPS